MEYKKIRDTIIVRLDAGEEIVRSLKKIVETENIQLGTVQGIGATDRLKIGLFDVSKKKYHSKSFTGDHEIVPLIGNISTKDGKPYLHLHINVADRNNNSFGGHLNEAYISATCEIFIRCIDGEVNRVTDEKTGLNMFKF